MIFIKHHLGMGDSIVHNGMVRKIYEDNKCNVTVASKFSNIENVKFMYRDNPNINVIGVNNDYDMNNHITNNKYDRVISTHYDNNNLRYELYFDDAFYLIADINPNVKKEYFHVERDVNVENNVYDELITKNGIKDYIFIHEKQNENILIDRLKIRNDLPIVSADSKYGIFQLFKIIENATECHVISSCFLSLFTCKKYNENIFAHMYADRLELKDYITDNNINVII